MSQVVIVGAGPTGATLALLLVKQGIAVKLIEASRNFNRVFRGEGLMPSGLDALEQMGLSSVVESIPHRPLDTWEFIIDKRSLFRVDEPMEPGGKPTTLVSQPAFLQALLDLKSAYPNFEFVQGATVQDLLWTNGRVSGVKLGDDRSIHADLVIGADGRNSIVRQRASLPIQQQSQSFDVLWFKMADSRRFEAENVFYSILHGNQIMALFRSSEGNLQVSWALHKDTPINWKQVADWSELFAQASPSWLAEHFRQHAQTIERPVLLSVVVGRCPRWYAPGLMLLGDAAHPMSPIRAQGINMALRDVIVALNHLLPVLLSGAEHAAIDAALLQIQTEREPEIVRVQQLQSEEAAQGELLHKSAVMRWVAKSASTLPPLRNRLRQSWLDRQHELRQGITQVKLSV